MSYQQGNKKPGGASYPKQQYYPPPQHGGAPYPPNSLCPHNPPALYPPSNALYPPNPSYNVGFNSNLPMQMPQPPSVPVYQPSAPPSTHYSPPMSAGHPLNTYPSGTYHTNSTYSAQASRYPGGYPPNSYPLGTYPPTSYPGAPPGDRGYVGAHGGFSYTNHSSAGYQAPQRTPTVRPFQPFEPRKDAESLRKAMKGLGCDDKALVNILAYRTNAQRVQIEKEYKVLFGRDLIEDLKSETRGNLETLLVALVTPLPVYYAKELHHAMQGLGTDEDVLIEIMCTKSNAEIMTIRKAYHALYNTSLEKDLKGDTGGWFKRLMVSLCNAGRDESMVTNLEAARRDAQQLLQAGELKCGTDESTFNMVLCQRNWAQLQLVFQEYQKSTGHDIEVAIKKEFSGDIERGLLAVIRSIKNQAAFFAKLLNKSMKGLGTNDRALIRLVVTRSEIDMVEIKREYEARFGETLADAIKGDTSGSYKKCLLALVGEGENS